MDFLTLVSWASSAIDDSIAAVVAWAYAQFGVLYNDAVTEQGERRQNEGILQSEIAAIVGFLTDFWDWLHNKVLSKIFDLICKIQDFLRRVLAPLLCVLRWLRCWHQYIFDTYIKPLYDLVQRLRSALVIFRLLGFKWAQSLDAYLVSQEQKLTGAFLAVLQNLNRLADWINYIIDPFGLFAPNVWLSSISRSIGAMIGIALGRMNDPAFISTPDGVVLADNYYDEAVFTARMQTRWQIGLLPEDVSLMDEVRQDFAALGFMVQ